MSEHSPDLTPSRRRRELSELADEKVDLVVIGGGATGCGVALDAAARGLSVALLERDDLGSGTSAFSSKLIHGGLRYLAQAQFGVAAESARERHHLMTRIAPHLIEPLATLIPFTQETGFFERSKLRIGYKLGDALRRSAGTPAALLARSHRVSAAAAVELAPALAQSGLKGALVGWDGRLEDDVRLVLALARTAAAHGARIITRAEVTTAGDGRVELRDRVSGENLSLEAGAVINATGVWADRLAGGFELTPSRGSHVIVSAASLGHPRASLTVPAHGGGAKFVFAVPTAEETVMIGLTDVDATQSVEQRAVPEQWEIDLLLETISSVLDVPLGPADVRGSFAGLRPLLKSHGSSGASSDVSRRHQVIRDSESAVVSIVGGKLTTYRQMAEDAVDAVSDRPCTTKTLPLVGAAGEPDPAAAAAPERLRRRFGNEASRVVAVAESDPALLSPLTQDSEISIAELRFCALNELVLDVDDLLDRRVRAGLTPALRDRLTSAAGEALAWAGEHNQRGA